MEYYHYDETLVGSLQENKHPLGKMDAYILYQRKQHPDNGM